MQNMWKRETVQPRASYVDLFASIPNDEAFQMQLMVARSAIRHKDNELSRTERAAGDNHFINGNYSDAMKKYMSSLRYAEIDSNYFVLAFVSATTCNNILHELNEQNGSTLLDTAQQSTEFTPTLDYAANEKFPCLANVVDVNYDPRFGRHLVAKSDIPQDKVILVEEAFAMSFEKDMNVCNACFNSYEHFIVCERCVYAVFCSLECKNGTHAFECGSVFGSLPEISGTQFLKKWLRSKIVVQTILNVLALFSTVEELMEFVEKTLLEEPHTSLTFPMHDAISEYRFFLKLHRFVRGTSLTLAKNAYILAAQLPQIRSLFNTTEKERFFMHLVAYHTLITETNAVEGVNTIVIHNVYSLLNHSCEPNVRHTLKRKLRVGRTTRPVKKGEQLFSCYLSTYDRQYCKSCRKSLLQEGWGFSCECSKCERE